jgi:transcriptional regulator with XRE-family HTH domain
LEGPVTDFEPFVAFVQSDFPDVDLDAPLPLTGEDVLPVSTSFFGVLQQKILDPEEGEAAIGEEVFKVDQADAIRPPERATNKTAAVKDGSEQLEPFAELNARDKRVPWKDRYEVVKQQFPSVQSLDWERVFRADPTIMGNILNDIIKVEVAPKGRPGKRPALEKEQAREVLSRYKSEDYTLLPFAKAVNRLKETQSVRQFARKVSMSPTYAYNLMMGYRDPSVEDMELVASAYGKNPSYFYEYRVAYVTSLMAERMDYAPESSIIYYERAVQARRDAE